MPAAQIDAADSRIVDREEPAPTTGIGFDVGRPYGGRFATAAWLAASREAETTEMSHRREATVPRTGGGRRTHPQGIGGQVVQRYRDRGTRALTREERAQLVEVLPRREFEEEHLPQAINLPLETLTLEAADRHDRSRPVIVYCRDDA